MAHYLQRARRRAHGGLILYPQSGPYEEHLDTVNCPHCGMPFVIDPGSGRERGWCFKCGESTCGNKPCDVCAPWEQQMEDMEAADGLRRLEADLRAEAAYRIARNIKVIRGS